MEALDLVRGEHCPEKCKRQCKERVLNLDHLERGLNVGEERHRISLAESYEFVR